MSTDVKIVIVFVYNYGCRKVAGNLKIGRAGNSKFESGGLLEFLKYLVFCTFKCNELGDS